MRGDRWLIWALVVVLILLLSPLLGMLGMMAMHGRVGGNMMNQMGGGMMGWGLTWIVLGVIALLLVIALLIRVVTRQ